MTESVVSLREAAEHLGVHYMTAYRYVRLGILPASKVGATWNVRMVDLEAFRAGEGLETEPSRNRHVAWDERLEARLLSGDHGGAWSVIEAAMSSGMDVPDVYLEVLAPALRSIGARWHDDDIDIAAEHRASGIAQRIIGRLGHRMVRRGRTRGTVVVGTPQGELHNMPVAILSDLLRSGGWEVMDLGNDLPPSSFVAGIKDADRLVAVGVSATSPGNLPAAGDTIRELKGVLGETPVMLGGSAIRDEAHARELGADLWAPDGRAALELLDAL